MLESCRLEITAPNLDSAGIVFATIGCQPLEGRLHYAIFFQFLVKGAPGDAESPRGLTLVAAG